MSITNSHSAMLACLRMAFIVYRIFWFLYLASVCFIQQHQWTPHIISLTHISPSPSLFLILPLPRSFSFSLFLALSNSPFPSLFLILSLPRSFWFSLSLPLSHSPFPSLFRIIPLPRSFSFSLSITLSHSLSISLSISRLLLFFYAYLAYVCLRQFILELETWSVEFRITNG